MESLKRQAQPRVNIPSELLKDFYKFCDENLYGRSSQDPIIALVREALVARRKQGEDNV